MIARSDGAASALGFSTMSVLAPYLQNRTIVPAELSVYREVKYDNSGRDTVQFAGLATDYTITPVTGRANCWIVTQVVANGGVQDGTDMVCNFERIQFQGGGGSFYPTGQGPYGPTFANFDIDTLHINKADAAFEVILSQKRPEGYLGDWWENPWDLRKFVDCRLEFDTQPDENTEV